MTMTLLTTELKVLFRKKVYLIFSILLPLFFYLIFTSILDLPKAQQQVFNKEYMYSMVVFSLLNFCMMSFPLDMIEERANGWYKRLMVTPMSMSRYYGVKVVRTMIQFLLSIVIIFVVAHFSKDVTMSIAEWMLSGILLWIGASLFLTFGLVIAQFDDTQKASSIANMICILLAIAGGLWFPTTTFPDWMQQVSKWMPTYHLKAIAYDLSKGSGINVQSFSIIFIYSIFALIIALWINHRKDVS